MAGRAWGIKLGSGGICVPFCERHHIVGIGWRMVDGGMVSSGDRDRLWGHVSKVCTFYKSNRDVGAATGQLYRFGWECKEGDYVLYYDPPQKHVRICRVISRPLYRDFDLESRIEGEEVDIWHYRKVEYPVAAIPILDFYGGLKGSLLGPRMSFWDMSLAAEKIDQIARGQQPHVVAAPDPEIESAYRHLRELVVRRAEALNERDWEWVVVDYLKAQGAHVDERHVGGSRPIIDVEARFDHGELGEDVWRAQVKRYQGQRVDWPTIEDDFRKIGEANFCYVSVFGFTEEARRRAAEEDILLLEAGDFTPFLLTGKLREDVRSKLKLPFGLLTTQSS
jgi:hypothetical protein